MRNAFSIRSAIRVLAAAGVAGALVIVAADPAAAISSRPWATPQFNGTVYAIAYRGDTVYVGGSFTGVSVRGRTVERRRLAAFSARTGALLNWKPSVNGTVKALAVAGTGVYAAGTFGTVSGVRRDAVVRLDAATGKVGRFSHSVSGEARTLAVGNGRLYLGGQFRAVDGSPRGNLAAFSLSNGSLDRSWKPRTDDRVETLATYGARVYLGGGFHRVNGVRAAMRLAAVTATRGVLVKGFLPKPPAKVFGLGVDQRGVYAATGGAGGRAIAYTTAGRVRWTHLFNGDAYGITTLGGITYVGGHFDTACRAPSTIRQRGCVGAKVSRVKLAALDGRGRLTSWNPRANGVVGVRTLVTNRARHEIGAGGEFTAIGGVRRERYATFR